MTYTAVIWLGTHGSVSKGGFATLDAALDWCVDNLRSYPLNTGYTVERQPK